ncbi:hypothetical protein IFM47457_11105 [Aspergillus lentulus]|nr:hypothetical protein IFM47457_11105 [Aspergillus lentulus]
MAAPPKGSDPEWPPTNTQGATTEITTRDFSPPSEFRRVMRQYKHHKDGTTAIEITQGPLFEFLGSGDRRSACPDEILRAEVAACEPLQRPNTAPKPPKKELNCVYISTRQTPDEDEDGGDRFRRYLLTDIANTKIRSALLSVDPTKEI